MKKVLGFACVLAFIVTAAFSQGHSSDEEQIREVIKSFSRMWTESNGVQIGKEITSRNFLCIMAQESYDKERMLGFIANILKNKQVQKHNHEIYRILVKDAVAYEYGLVTMIMKNGNERKSEALNIFLLEDGKWKLMTSVPGEMAKELFLEF